MIMDTITEEARDQIRQMQGEIERLRSQLGRAKQLLSAVTKIAKRNEWSVDIVEAETFLSSC